jgi:hypothetical protein
VLADAELLTDQGRAVALLQEKLDDPEAELDGVGTAGRKAASLAACPWVRFEIILLSILFSKVTVIG